MDQAGDQCMDMPLSIYLLQSKREIVSGVGDQIARVNYTCMYAAIRCSRETATDVKVCLLEYRNTCT